MTGGANRFVRAAVLEAAYAASMVFLLMGCLPVSTAGAEESRGRILYENHCASCHDMRVHEREQRLPENLGELQREVERWQQNQGLH
ncbi:MAG: hypothetical protein WCK07_22675, partial [Betaproteobacteria bacterium]